MKVRTKYNQNLWDKAKTELKCKFTTLSAYIKEVKRSVINAAMMLLKDLEK